MEINRPFISRYGNVNSSDDSVVPPVVVIIYCCIEGPTYINDKQVITRYSFLNPYCRDISNLEDIAFSEMALERLAGAGQGGRDEV